MNILITKGISLVALVGYLALMFITLRQNYRRRVNQAFVLYLAAMAFWQLAAVIVSFQSQPEPALLWYRLMTAGMGLNDRVFPYSRQRVWQITRKYWGKGVHPHTFRHSFAVN